MPIGYLNAARDSIFFHLKIYLSGYVYPRMSIRNRRLALWNELKALGNPRGLKLSQKGLSADALEAEIENLRTPAVEALPAAAPHADHGEKEITIYTSSEKNLPSFAVRLTAFISPPGAADRTIKMIEEEGKAKREIRSVNRATIVGLRDIEQEERVAAERRAAEYRERAEEARRTGREAPPPFQEEPVNNQAVSMDFRYAVRHGVAEWRGARMSRKEVKTKMFVYKVVRTLSLAAETATRIRGLIGRYLESNSPILARTIKALGLDDHVGGHLAHIIVDRGGKYEGDDEPRPSIVHWMVIEFVSPLRIVRRTQRPAGIEFALAYNYGALPGDLAGVPRFLASKWVRDLVYDREHDQIVQRTAPTHDVVPGRCGYDLLISSYSEAWAKARAAGRRQKILKVEMSYEGLFEWYHGSAPSADADWGLSLEQIARFTQAAGTSLYVLPWSAADLDFYRRLRGDSDARHPVMFSSVVRDATASAARVRSIFAICQNNHLYSLSASKDTLGKLFGGAESVDQADVDLLEGARPTVIEWRSPNGEVQGDDLRGVPLLFGARTPLLVRGAGELPNELRFALQFDYAAAPAGDGLVLWDPAKARLSGQRMLPVVAGERPQETRSTFAVRVDREDELLRKMTSAVEGTTATSCRIHVCGDLDMDGVVRALWTRFSIAPAVRVKDGEITRASIPVGGVNYRISRAPIDRLDESERRRFAMSGRDTEFWAPTYDRIWKAYAPRLLSPIMRSEYAPDVHYVLRAYRHAGATGSLAGQFYPPPARAAIDFNQHHPGTLAGLRELPVVGSWDRFEPYGGQMIERRALYVAEIDISDAENCCLAIAVESIGAYWGDELLYLAVHGGRVKPLWVLRPSSWIRNPWGKWYPRFLAACECAPPEVRKRMSVRITGMMQRIRDCSGSGTLHARPDVAAEYFANVKQIEALRPLGQEGAAGDPAIFLAWNDNLSLYKSGLCLAANYFLAHCRLKVARLVGELERAGGRVVGLHVDQIDFVGPMAVANIGRKKAPGAGKGPSLDEMRIDSHRLAERVLGPRLARARSAEIRAPGYVKFAEPRRYTHAVELRAKFAETAPRWKGISALIAQYREEESIETMIARECRGHEIRDKGDLNLHVARGAIMRAESALTAAKSVSERITKSITEESKRYGPRSPLVGALRQQKATATAEEEKATSAVDAARAQLAAIENEIAIASAGAPVPPPPRRPLTMYTCRDPLERDAEEFRAFFARARAEHAPVFVHGAAPGVGKTYIALNYARPNGARLLVATPYHALEQSMLSGKGADGEPLGLMATTHCKLLGVNPITHTKGERRFDLREFAGATILIDEFFVMPRYIQAEMLAFIRQNRDKYAFVATGCAHQNTPIGDPGLDPEIAALSIREVFRDNIMLRIIKRVREGESPAEIACRSSELRHDTRAMEAIISGRNRAVQRAAAMKVLERQSVRDLPPLIPGTGVLSAAIPLTALPSLADIENGKASIIVYMHATRRAICDAYYAAGDWPKVGQRLIACRDELAAKAARDSGEENHWSHSRRAFVDVIDGLGVHFYSNCEYIVEAIHEDGVIRLQLAGDIPRESLRPENATGTMYLPATFGDAIRNLKFAWARAFVAGCMNKQQAEDFEKWLAPHALGDSIIRALFMPAVARTGHSSQGASLGGVVHVYDAWRSFAKANWLYVASSRSSAGRTVVHLPTLRGDEGARQRGDRGVPIVCRTRAGLVIADWIGTRADGSHILGDWRPWDGKEWVPVDIREADDAQHFLDGRRERGLLDAAALAQTRAVRGRPPTNVRLSAAARAAREREWPTERDLGAPIGNLALAHVASEQHFAPMAEDAISRRLKAGNKMIEGRRTLAEALAAIPDAEVVIQDVEAGHRFAAFSCAALAVDWAAAKLAGGSQMSIHEWIRFDRATYLPVDFEAEGVALDAMRGIDLLGSIRRALEKVFPGVKCLICAAHKWAGEGADRRFAKASFHVHTKVVVRSLPEAKAAAKMFRDALPAEMRRGVDMQIYSSGHALRMAYSDKFDHGAWAQRPKQVVEMIGYRAYSAAEMVERMLSGAPEPEDAAPGSVWGLLAETISAVPVAKVLSAHELALNDEIAAAAEEEQFASATRIAVAEPADSAAISLAVKEGVFADGEWAYYRSAVRADGRRRVYLLRAAGVAGRACELCGWTHTNNNLCLNLVPAEGKCAVHVGCARRSEIGRKIGEIDA